MRAVVKSATGLGVQDCPLPNMTSPDDVVIAVQMAGLCRTDIYAARGLLPVATPRILGHEFSGVVYQKGVGVRHLKEGDAVGVMPIFESAGKTRMLGVDEDGGFAEYVRVPASHVYSVPKTLSMQEAAYLEPVAASLAVLEAPIEKHQLGVIYGDNRIAELTARVLACKGFDSVVTASVDTPGLKPNHYDFAIETQATEATLAALVHAVKPGGIIILKSRPTDPVPMPITQIVQKNIHLIGTHYGNFQDGIDLVASGALQVRDLFGEDFSLEESIGILSGKTPADERKKIFFRP